MAPDRGSHLDGRASGHHALTTHETVGHLHGNAAHVVVSHVLRHLQHQALGVILDLQGARMQRRAGVGGSSKPLIHAIKQTSLPQGKTGCLAARHRTARPPRGQSPAAMPSELEGKYLYATVCWCAPVRGLTCATAPSVLVAAAAAGCASARSACQPNALDPWAELDEAKRPRAAACLNMVPQRLAAGVCPDQWPALPAVPTNYLAVLHLVNLMCTCDAQEALIALAEHRALCLEPAAQGLRHGCWGWAGPQKARPDAAQQKLIRVYIHAPCRC